MDPKGFEAPDDTFDTAIPSFSTCTFLDPVAVSRETARVSRSDEPISFLEHGRSDSGLAARHEAWSADEKVVGYPYLPSSMHSLHAGHPTHESVFIIALSLVALATAFALTRDGWSRVGALLGTAVVAGGARIGVEALGIHAHGALHLFGHGLELSVIATSVLAGYYALSARSSVRTAAE
jgi:hypothetical protein